MREVLRTHLLSDAEAARLALEAEGIRAEILDQHAMGYAGLAGEIRVAVADRDAARAQEILAALRPPPVVSATPESWRWQRPGCLLLGVSLLAVFPLSFVVWNSGAPPFAKVLVMSGAVVTLLGGVVLTTKGMIEATRERTRELFPGRSVEADGSEPAEEREPEPAGSHTEDVGEGDEGAPGRVPVPPGHRVMVYTPVDLPMLQRTHGGALIADLGSSSDEWLQECEALAHDIAQTLFAKAREDAHRARPVLLASDVTRLPDLFAPQNPKVVPLKGLLIWVLDADAAHLWCRDPKVLTAAIRRFGSPDRQGAVITQLVLLRVLQRPVLCRVDDVDVELEGQMPPGTAELIAALRATGVRVARVPDAPFLVEVERPDGIVSAVRGEPFADDLRPDGDGDTPNTAKPAHCVSRAPRLHRLIRAALEQRTPTARAQLLDALREMDIAVLIRSKMTGGLPLMTWPDGRGALPVFPDLTSLEQAADDLGIEHDALTWMQCTPRQLYDVVRNEPEPCVALNTFVDRSTPKYLLLEEDDLVQLADGR